MRPHREIPLSENVLALSGTFEAHRAHGMQVAPAAVRELCDALGLLHAQARQMENTNRELVRELTEEEQLKRPIGQITPLERDVDGTMQQRLEWMVRELTIVAGRISRLHPDLFQEAGHLRYLGMQGMVIADHLAEMPADAIPPRSGLRSWVRAVIPGGRS